VEDRDYLNNLLCLREAKSRGADEVIITNLAGEITEAAVRTSILSEMAVCHPGLESGLLAHHARLLINE